ncbi:hypothetical protein DFH27DRAFT_243941 [Peziza echinospora]|nr:hypothetical protein DFH27DRAFT_243941 [Peziza echinospora]
MQEEMEVQPLSKPVDHTRPPIPFPSIGRIQDDAQESRTEYGSLTISNSPRGPHLSALLFSTAQSDSPHRVSDDNSTGTNLPRSPEFMPTIVGLRNNSSNSASTPSSMSISSGDSPVRFESGSISPTRSTNSSKGGRIPKCIRCKQLAAPRKTLVQCTLCAFHYHTHCHSPVITTSASGKIGVDIKTWACSRCYTKKRASGSLNFATVGRCGSHSMQESDSGGTESPNHHKRRKLEPTDQPKIHPNTTGDQFNVVFSNADTTMADETVNAQRNQSSNIVGNGILYFPEVPNIRDTQIHLPESNALTNSQNEVDKDNESRVVNENSLSIDTSSFKSDVDQSSRPSDEIKPLAGTQPTKNLQPLGISPLQEDEDEPMDLDSQMGSPLAARSPSPMSEVQIRSQGIFNAPDIQGETQASNTLDIQGQTHHIAEGPENTFPGTPKVPSEISELSQSEPREALYDAAGDFGSQASSPPYSPRLEDDALNISPSNLPLPIEQALDISPQEGLTQLPTLANQSQFGIVPNSILFPPHISPILSSPITPAITAAMFAQTTLRQCESCGTTFLYIEYARTDKRNFCWVCLVRTKTSSEPHVNISAAQHQETQRLHPSPEVGFTKFPDADYSQVKKISQSQLEVQQKHDNNSIISKRLSKDLQSNQSVEGSVESFPSRSSVRPVYAKRTIQHRSERPVERPIEKPTERRTERTPEDEPQVRVSRPKTAQEIMAEKYQSQPEIFPSTSRYLPIKNLAKVVEERTPVIAGKDKPDSREAREEYKKRLTISEYSERRKEKSLHSRATTVIESPRTSEVAEDTGDVAEDEDDTVRNIAPQTQVQPEELLSPPVLQETLDSPSKVHVETPSPEQAVSQAAEKLAEEAALWRKKYEEQLGFVSNYVKHNNKMTVKLKDTEGKKTELEKRLSELQSTIEARELAHQLKQKELEIEYEKIRLEYEKSLARLETAKGTAMEIDSEVDRGVYTEATPKGPPRLVDLIDKHDPEVKPMSMKAFYKNMTFDIDDPLSDLNGPSNMSLTEPPAIIPAPRFSKSRKTEFRLFDSTNMKKLHVHREVNRTFHSSTTSATNGVGSTMPDVVSSRATSTSGETGFGNTTSFDEFARIPENIIPVLKDGVLAFRSGQLHARHKRLERNVPHYKVGRDVPGELRGLK